MLADIGLEVAEAKSGIVRSQDGFGFLGFTFRGRFLRPRPSGLSRFKDRVRARTRRQAPISLGMMVEDQLEPLMSGWGSYYALGEVMGLFTDLDGWIRKRLRSKARWRSRQDSSRRSSQVAPDLDDLGLVRLEPLARTHRLSPA